MRRKVLPLLLRDAQLLAYHAGAVLLSPLLWWRKWRLFRVAAMNCEFDIARWKIRFEPHSLSQHLPDKEISPAPPKMGPRVMFVTYGWGEVNTMEPLIRSLRAELPDMHAMFTVKHREALASAAKLSDAEVVPLPFDHIWPVARWLERTRPDLVVFYEHFHLPILLRALSLTSTPFVIIHARMQRGISKSLRRVAYQRWQLKGVRHICFSSPTHLLGAHQLLSPHASLHVTGSIKFPVLPTSLPPAQEGELKDWVETHGGSARLLIAGSTHQHEEAFVLDAWQQIVEEQGREQAPPLLLAPRDPRRCDEVSRLVQCRGLSLSRRSKFASGDEKQTCDVLLLDTLGELASVYKFGVGCFVGGTVNGSSHNVTEPLLWGLPVAYGLIRGNFAVEQQMCEEQGVGFRVSSSQQLAAHWSELLRSPNMQTSISEKAHDLVQSQQNAFANTINVLLGSINSVQSGSP